MKTYNCNSEAGTKFHYNSDMSGNVEIVYGFEMEKKASIPAKDLLEFVAEHLRQEAIAKLEQMNTSELLQLPQAR